MTSPKYTTFEDFTREEIKPGLRAGWSIDSIHDPTDPEENFDLDPFETALLEAELEDAEEEGDDAEE